MSKRKRAHVEPRPASPLLAAQTLPAPLLAAWQSELSSADSPEERAHWWTQPHWIGSLPTTGDCDPHGLISATLRHVRSQLGSDLQLSQAVGVEFWIQRRLSNSSLHLHWDVDEELCRLEQKLMCPLVSVILYLGDLGGPTLVLDRTPHQDQRTGGPLPAWLLWPHAGQIAAFRGDLLHAVLGLPPPVAEQTELGCRMTVIFNYWATCPVNLPPLPALLVPPLPQMPAQTAKKEEQAAHRIRKWTALQAAQLLPKTLLLGQADRSEQVKLRLPEVVYGGYHMEIFDAAWDQEV